MAGRPPKEKSFANMLNIALAAAGKEPGTTKLRDVAEVLVDKATAGESWAVQMVADRTDGKVAQAIVGDDEHDAISLITRIELVAPGHDNSKD